MVPTKQNESIVWKYFLKKLIAKCKYYKKKLTSSGNKPTWKSIWKGVSFHCRLKKASQKENQREEPMKEAKTVIRILGTKIWKFNLKMIVQLQVIIRNV
jgi:hypothetical protein